MTGKTLPNRKTTFVTTDAKYQMVYTPQRQTSPLVTKLASFDLQKRCDRGDLGISYITIKGYAHNFVPSRAFPLADHIEKVMQMLVTDYNAEQWFTSLGRKVTA